MSLEEKIVALTAAIEANTAALKAGGGAAKTGKTETKTETAGYTAKHDKAEMQAALNDVKEKLGTPAAKAIVKEVGKAEKMAEITDPKLIDACYDAAKAKLKESADNDV